MEVDMTIDPSDHAAVMPVVIRTVRGDFSANTSPLAPGDRGYRLSLDTLRSKFFDNAANSEVTLGLEVQCDIADAALNLDLLDDICDVIELLG